jgi:hypothetical protein
MSLLSPYLTAKHHLFLYGRLRQNKSLLRLQPDWARLPLGVVGRITAGYIRRNLYISLAVACYFRYLVAIAFSSPASPESEP